MWQLRPLNLEAFLKRPVTLALVHVRQVRAALLPVMLLNDRHGRLVTTVRTKCRRSGTSARKLVLRLEISPHHADPAVSHDLRPIGHRTAMSRRGRTCASGVGPGLALELRHSVVRKQFPIRALEHPHENSREDEDATYDYHIGTRRSSETSPTKNTRDPESANARGTSVFLLRCMINDQ